MLAFRKYIEKYTNISESDWDFVQQIFERKEIKKNEILVEQGKVCKYFYFLEKGLIRFFTVIDGNDITKMFTIAPGCFTSKSSFRSQNPSKESIQAIEDSIALQVEYKHLDRLSNLEFWNKFIRKFIFEIDEFTEEFLIEIQTETAENRYLKLIEKYPTIVHRIPLKYLSSFLGIAPQSLSRIRKKLHNSKKLT